MKGAIGEEAITALLKEKSIELDELNKLPNTLFEVVDAQVKGLPIYIDFKNWGKSTIEKFALTKDDYGYDSGMNSEETKEKLKSKLEKIIKATKEKNAKLFMINLVEANHVKPTYFNLKIMNNNNNNELEEYQVNNSKHTHAMEESNIIVIPSALDKDDPTKITNIFNDFIDFINKAKEQNPKNDEQEAI